MAASSTLGLGPLTQLAWVVDDLDAAEEEIGRLLDATPWTRMPGIEFGPETCTYRGEPADFVADVSLAYCDDLQLELVRPVSGSSVYRDYLEAHGPGLHHVCCEVDDLDDVLERARTMGVEVPQQGSMGGGAMEFAYLRVAHAGASLVEVARVSPELQSFFDTIRGR